jgi:hypothetical protein
MWKETVRTEQKARFQALELQAGDEMGERAWELAAAQWNQFPEDIRVDLPSARVFGRILGLFRTGATLKKRKLLRLELSAQEIADLLGYSKSTIEAALRWLGCGTIEYRGDVFGKGIGLIHRARRTAWAFLEGRFQKVYRTSKTLLTLFGRMVCGLGARDDERRKEQQKVKSMAQKAAAATPPSPASPSTSPRREEQHVQG